jgi:hypothetical protein
VKVGVYLAQANELHGNCVHLAVGAETLWRRSVCAGFTNPGRIDGARIVEDAEGNKTKQLIVQNFFREDVVDVIIHDVE